MYVFDPDVHTHMDDKLIEALGAEAAERAEAQSRMDNLQAQLAGLLDSDELLELISLREYLLGEVACQGCGSYSCDTKPCHGGNY